MSKSPRKPGCDLLENGLYPARRRKLVPHEFVLDAIASLAPYTGPMFGCLAVYVHDKIVLILRDKPTHTPDNGVWLATTKLHHESLRREFPAMRSVQIFGKPVTDWQVLPADAPDFETAAFHACELVLRGDERIGKIPGARRVAKSKSGSAKVTTKSSKQSTSKTSTKHRPQ